MRPRLKLVALLLAVLALFTVSCTDDFWEELDDSFDSPPSTWRRTTTTVDLWKRTQGEFQCIVFLSGSQQQSWQRQGGETWDLVELLENQLCQEVAPGTSRANGTTDRNWVQREVFKWDKVELSNGVAIRMDLGRVSNTPLQDTIVEDELWSMAFCLEGSSWSCGL